VLGLAALARLHRGQVVSVRLCLRQAECHVHPPRVKQAPEGATGKVGTLVVPDLAATRCPALLQLSEGGFKLKHPAAKRP
jgi:hypothetical protein